jgi:hypothetical protein
MSAVFTKVQRRFLEELGRRRVPYLVVGMTAAVLQGVRVVTRDVDLWFERLDDPRIAEAARAVGAIWVSGTFGMRPPMLGGVLGERFDVVTNVDGADSFATERARAVKIEVAGLELPVMPLARVLATKRASARPKDLAQIPAIEETIAVMEDVGETRGIRTRSPKKKSAKRKKPSGAKKRAALAKVR